MPSREFHLRRDREIVGEEFDEVHKLLDQFAHYPDMRFLRRHRRFLHHHEGIEYVRMRWGDRAAQSAEQHVKDDCGHVPHAADYYDGTVDEFGGKR